MVPSSLKVGFPPELTQSRKPLTDAPRGVSMVILNLVKLSKTETNHHRGLQGFSGVVHSDCPHCYHSSRSSWLPLCLRRWLAALYFPFLSLDFPPRASVSLAEPQFPSLSHCALEMRQGVWSPRALRVEAERGWTTVPRMLCAQTRLEL